MNILSIDQGTTSSRAMIINEEGKVISVAQYPITQHYPEPGWVEHDAEEIVETTLRAVGDCLYGFSEKIDAIGITNQRETTIVWDKYSAKPLARAIVWQCRRTAPICESLIEMGLEDYVKNTTGLNIDAYFSATKLKWLLDNDEKIRSAAEKGDALFGTVESYLIYVLTGNHFTDVSNASRTMMFDINKLCWDEKICDILGIPMKMLPKVKDNCAFFGSVVKNDDIPSKIWGVPIFAAMGDQQAALFGQTCFEIGDVKNTYGTGCFTLMNIGNKPVFDKELVTSIAWKCGDEICYALEGSVFNAGSSVQWLRDEMKMIESAAECSALAETVDSTEGAVFVSAFTGLGAPYWDMYARGAFLGITRGCGRAHLCRAVLEGIAFQVKDLVETMERVSGLDIKALYVDGGASVSNFMMQFQADILDSEVDRPSNIETTALGAGYMAALGAGLLAKDDLKGSRKNERIFKPSFTKEQIEENYSRWQRAVKAVRL